MEFPAASKTFIDFFVTWSQVYQTFLEQVMQNGDIILIKNWTVGMVGGGITYLGGSIFLININSGEIQAMVGEDFDGGR